MANIKGEIKDLLIQTDTLQEKEQSLHPEAAAKEVEGTLSFLSSGFGWGRGRWKKETNQSSHKRLAVQMYEVCQFVNG